MTETPLHWLEHADQRLALCPAAGGSVATWQWLRQGQAIDIWRPWHEGSGHPRSSDMASFVLVPWSNRIGGGGFSHAGKFHRLQPNSEGEPLPIHGDGWLQPWTLQQTGRDAVVMRLTSCRFMEAPHHYQAEQSFRLFAGGMAQTLSVTNLGQEELPFGLGSHPWFVRTPQCRVQAPVQAVWLAHPDKLPVARTQNFPEGWNLHQAVYPACAEIDNSYENWNGYAELFWPERALQVTVQARLDTPAGAGRLGIVLYTPAHRDVFCFEPVSHPINAPHLPGQPGWHALQPHQSMKMSLIWRLHSPCPSGHVHTSA